MNLFTQQVLNGLALGSVYAIFAMGFGLVFAIMGILNAAHGIVATWGAIIALWAMITVGVSFPVAFVVGCVGAGLLGVLIDQLAFQRLRALRSGLLGPFITSVGISIILTTLAQNVTDARARSFPAGSLPSNPNLYRFGSLSLTSSQIMAMVAMAVVAISLHLFLVRTRFGAAMRAVGWSDRAAAIVGVNPRLVAITTAFLASAIAGLAGIIRVSNTNQVTFVLADDLLLKGFAAVVIGGFGDVRGTAIGGLIIGLCEVLAGQYVSNSFKEAITFGLLLGFLVTRPRGLFGKTEFKPA